METENRKQRWTRISAGLSARHVSMKVMRAHINRAEFEHPNGRCLHRDNTILILE